MSRVVRAVVVLFALFVSTFAAAQAGMDDTGPRPYVPKNRWALVVGVSGYSDEIGSLDYTAREAKEFSETLVGGLGFAPDNVRLLADKGQGPVEPTSSNILSALDEMLKDPRLDKANLFVFYFTGHGVATPRGDFLLPLDARKDRLEEMGVPVREVIEKIVGAGLKNVLFITDACRAGTPNDFGADLTRLCHQANLAVILGCAPGKRSYEMPEAGQGVFTHYLMEALKKPELRDESGALWASRLGADVQARVREYTEPEHPKSPQVPTLWGERSTLDVLLGAYPQPPVSDIAVQSFKSTAKRLDQKDYAAAMIAYADALYEKDRTDAAVEILKTVDALGELTPEARLVLGTALTTLGRTAEAERVYAAFAKMAPGFWRDLGVATSNTRDLDPAERVDSARRLFETTDDWNLKFLAYGVVKNFGSNESQVFLAKRLAASGPSARQRRYGASEVAILEGRWTDALRALDEARTSPGNVPEDALLYLSKITPLVALGDPKAVEAFYDEGTKIPSRAAFAWIGKARLAKERKDVPGLLAALRSALTSDPSPQEIMMAAKVAGMEIAPLAAEFKRETERHPYSWRARLTHLLIAQITHDGSEREDVLAADRYLDDPLTFDAVMFEFLDAMMTEGVEDGRIPVPVFLKQLDGYFLLMKDQAGRFGYDGGLWLQLVRYGMFNERNAQVNAVVARHMKFAPGKTPKSLRTTALLLAMNRGDHAAAKATFESGFEATERTDPAWIVACYEASLGHPKEARRIIGDLAPPSPELASRTEALKTFLLAAEGRAAEARKRLAGTSDDAVENAFRGLAWAELGDWARAEPLLLESATKRVWAFLYLQEAALARLDARYRTTGRVAQARDLALSAAISQPGNPLFDPFSFAAKPLLTAYAGATSMGAGTLDDNDERTQGPLTFSATAAGAFTGRYVATDGAAMRLSGKVDAYGNVRGTATWKGKSYALTAKIAPAALYGSYAKFHSVGQLFQLVDAEGSRVVVVART